MVKVGFRVTTDILFQEHPEAVAVEVDEEALRKELAAAFLEILKDRVPQIAEANGYTTEKVQVGVQVFFLEPTDEKPTHFLEKAQGSTEASDKSDG